MSGKIFLSKLALMGRKGLKYHHALFCEVFCECISCQEDPPALPTYQNGSVGSPVVCCKIIQKFSCFKNLHWAQPAKRGEHFIHVPEVL